MSFLLDSSTTPETLPIINLVARKELPPYVTLGGLFVGGSCPRDTEMLHSSFHQVVCILKTPMNYLVGELGRKRGNPD